MISWIQVFVKTMRWPKREESGELRYKKKMLIGIGQEQKLFFAILGVLLVNSKLQLMQYYKRLEIQSMKNYFQARGC